MSDQQPPVEEVVPTSQFTAVLPLRPSKRTSAATETEPSIKTEPATDREPTTETATGNDTLPTLNASKHSTIAMCDDAISKPAAVIAHRETLIAKLNPFLANKPIPVAHRNVLIANKAALIARRHDLTQKNVLTKEKEDIKKYKEFLRTLLCVGYQASADRKALTERIGSVVKSASPKVQKVFFGVLREMEDEATARAKAYQACEAEEAGKTHKTE
ncbi:hypothetical protein E8E11_008614 [Didymella keratinophila]|nr:hypothetical protein E8E11_008614 [Didymella keratinophila]